MRHATDADLDRVEGLLQKIRTFDALVERKRGVFYFKSKAFLHFHEDPAGMFADVRSGDDFERLPASSAAEYKAILAKVRAALSTKS